MKWLYARISSGDPDQYNVMASVTEREGRIIVARANEQSHFNKEVDDVIDEWPQQPKGDMERNFPPDEKPEAQQEAAPKKRRSKKDG